ncbi:MAG: DUF370 domain-containing protein [Clostridiales bacterium]|nr:DUF370 domain-containing protein [Clostridiales bacterium]
MILHLGGNEVVPMKDIIAIMDLKKTEQAPVNIEFLNIAKEEGFVRRISDEPIKSYILVEVDKKTILYLSPISSTTLLKRSRSVTDFSVDKQLNKGDIK